jgi:hypothetical protein
VILYTFIRRFTNLKQIPESLDMEVEEESNQEEEDSLNEIDDDHPDMMSTSDIFDIHSHSARRREPAMLADSSESRDEARLVCIFKILICCHSID